MSYTRHPHFHITTRTKSRCPFKIPLSNLWSGLQLILKEMEGEYKFELTSLVLMHNHYHLLIRMNETELLAFVTDFNKRIEHHGLVEMDQNILLEPIRQRTYFFQCYRYIYQNPVRTKLVGRCEHYPYSTLFHITQSRAFSVFIYDLFCAKDRFGLNLINVPVHRNVS